MEEPDTLVKYGVLIEGRDIGTLQGFTFRGLEISHVNGTLDTRENGGLCMLISRSVDEADWIPSNFDGVLVDSCLFYNTSRSGFFTVSHWKTRDLRSSFGEETVNGRINEWYPSYNIIVRNSFEFMQEQYYAIGFDNKEITNIDKYEVKNESTLLTPINTEILKVFNFNSEKVAAIDIYGNAWIQLLKD